MVFDQVISEHKISQSIRIKVPVQSFSTLTGQNRTLQNSVNIADITDIVDIADIVDIMDIIVETSRHI